ncbi:MAG TPA: hypothetical protein VFQ53_41295 [Kofleriaceae bacterium]|nr:hypothetical protein [Kofleriaceae bacterium]
MTLPRPVIPGRFYMITRSCLDRHLFLRPSTDTNNAFAYCLAHAAIETEMEVMLTTQMSNHHHTVVFDRQGNYPKFMEYFHRTLARCMNAHLGRDEIFWSGEQPCVVELLEITAIIDKLAYAATNPVKDGLVENIADWPGVSTYDALLEGGMLVATRPTFFFRSDRRALPAQLEIPMVVPPELGDREVFLEVLREEVEKRVAEFASKREREGKRGVLGRALVLAQDCFARARAPREQGRNDIRPRFASKNKWARIEAAQRGVLFQFLYKRARSVLLAGRRPVFPRGSYFLPRFMNMPVESAVAA